MKKSLLLLSAIGFSCAFSANALFLPAPQIVSETPLENGDVTIEWTYDSAIEECTHFYITVFKMHKATEAGPFVLASTEFDHIESTGTMSKHEERGALWDVIPDAPGWYAKWPIYMDGALGIDTFNYFYGSDNEDIFGGAYLVSPDYDLTGLTDNTITIKARIANEASSVSGGFALWTWNTDWWDERNVDYKPVPEMDFHYDDLDNATWKVVNQTCNPDEYMRRTRVMFYGVGYSAFWIDNFEVSVNMAVGDKVDYAVETFQIPTGSNTFTIDRSADTTDDYTYAYEVRAVFEEESSRIPGTNYMRFVSTLKPRNIIGEFSGIENVVAPAEGAAYVSVDGRTVSAEGQVLTIADAAGRTIAAGVTEATVPSAGIYIVKAGSTVRKIVVR